MINSQTKREAEYKRDWINTHNVADEIVRDAETKELVAAIYYYPPTHHKAEMTRIWHAIAVETEISRLEEMEL